MSSKDNVVPVEDLEPSQGLSETILGRYGLVRGGAHDPVEEDEEVGDSFESARQLLSGVSLAPAAKHERPSLLGSTTSETRISQTSFRHIVPPLRTEEMPAGVEAFVTFTTRPVVHQGESVREVSAWSDLSRVVQDVSLPMAVDNDRFFAVDVGYKPLLDEAKQELLSNAASRTHSYWKEPASEVGFFGWLWRFLLRLYLWFTSDMTNRLRMTRGIQLWLPFQTGYESFTLNGVIHSFDLDQRYEDWKMLRLAFMNSNTSHTIVQNLGRFDYVWHTPTQVTWSRLFDMVAQIPFISLTSFPPTENFPSSKVHAIRAILRGLFQGSWLTRSLTRNTQALVAFDQLTPAVNLAAESTGLEAANRNQYSTYFGRLKTNEFRKEHSLPTDESIIRTFQASPASTMVNNGVEHVLRCLGKHWKNMLYQENGNFAHQRMEQLDPFETLRFFMPTVLTTLANLRGRNEWDTTTLGPFMQELQSFCPCKTDRPDRPDVEQGSARDAHHHAEIYAPCEAAQRLLFKLKKTILKEVCGGLASRMTPLEIWVDAIIEACNVLCIEAEAVRKFVASVDIGIQLGYMTLKLVDWHVPQKKKLEAAIISYICNDYKELNPIPRKCVGSALDKLAGKDKRTLIELVNKKLVSEDAGQLLLGRTATLLEREIRRETLDRRIRNLSVGMKVAPAALKKYMWYWVNSGNAGEIWRAHTFESMSSDEAKVNFIDVDTGFPESYDTASVQVNEYVPIGEAISRAQKAFMTIELDHGKRFSYNAFMEFGSPALEDSLRSRLLRLVTLSQVQCSELDKARINVLTEMKNSAKLQLERGVVAPCPPQSTIVLGGGPTGLMCAIHCIQNVILTGGEVKLYEARDAYGAEASAYQRAQIVRLDPRQISMLRYHLGTSFEDIFIPARGETDPHLGNSLPSQGFVEVTIKRLEAMLADEVVKLRSRDLIQFFTGSKLVLDDETGDLIKPGRSLNEGDEFYLENDVKSWKVAGFDFEKELSLSELVEGESYDIVPHRSNKVKTFRLERKEHNYDWYHFTAQDKNGQDIKGNRNSLPPIYKMGSGRVDPVAINLVAIRDGQASQRTLHFDEIAKGVRLDVSRCHVILAIGKPDKSKEHFYVTTGEPYAVCCIEGLKVALGMHNFGEKRWGSGLIDDIRSHTDQNTRIVGDFTKSVALVPIVVKMQTKLKENPWKSHFQRLAESHDELPTLWEMLLREVDVLSQTSFRRVRLQTRFFELGDNYYLGMELPREYDSWKLTNVLRAIPMSPLTSPSERMESRRKLRDKVLHHLDRLWYESTLEIIALGDVYNPGGRGVIPKLRTIPSPFEQTLDELEQYDSFALSDRSYRVLRHDGESLTWIQGESETGEIAVPNHGYATGDWGGEKKVLKDLEAGTKIKMATLFELLEKKQDGCIVRSARGDVIKYPLSTKVHRLSDLARGPDGHSESPVALASFPVAHVVCHRTVKVNLIDGDGSVQRKGEKDMGQEGYMMAFTGDAQASPHFMRYSGLTGACINGMSFNNFVGQALQGLPFYERVRRYAFETNWSNGEVVQRGSGNNYGDGFLRPGFTYPRLLDYLYGRATEHYSIGADVADILTRDWKVKIVASLVPRGLENDALFINALYRELHRALLDKFQVEAAKFAGLAQATPEMNEAVARETALLVEQWNIIPMQQSNSEGHAPLTFVASVEALKPTFDTVVKALKQAIDYSLELRESNTRISSELFNQPKPVDTLVDDFAVEAQNFANSFAISTTFAAGAIALSLVDDARYAPAASAILGILSIFVALGTITNSSRYKNRNEESRRDFADTKMSKVLKGVFSLLAPDLRQSQLSNGNPFATELDKLIRDFIDRAKYFNSSETAIAAFEHAYDDLKRSINDNGSVITFVQRLLDEFLPVTFQENSYLQEDLVGIYKCLFEMLRVTQQSKQSALADAERLYESLVAFRSRLESTIERNEVKYGFIRHRPWTRQALPVTLRFIGSCFIPSKWRTSISAATDRLVAQAKEVQATRGFGQVLSYEVRDLEELSFATKESEIASMIFLSSSIVFVSNLVFTILRLIIFAAHADDSTGPYRIVFVVTAWASVISLFGAILALYHFGRKLRYLGGLYRTLGSTRYGGGLSRIRNVVLTQAFLTFLRIAFTVAACVALPWASLASTFPDQVDPRAPRVIANAAVITALLSVAFFFYVEFVIRYRLDPQLGRVVCEPLYADIEEVKRKFATRVDMQIETRQTVEREMWEYTAREFLHRYRFDVVFAADRFGTILQYIQSGDFEELGGHLKKE